MRLEISVALECISQRPCAKLWPVVMFTGRMIVGMREEMMLGPAVDFYFRPRNVSGSFAFLVIYTYILSVQITHGLAFIMVFGTLWYVFRGKKGILSNKNKEN